MTTPSGKYTYANGRRKTAVAKVRLYKGEGKMTVNDKEATKYFGIKTLIGLINSPLKMVGKLKEFDATVVVKGGGESAQAEAIRHGIARALIEIDPLSKTTLKKAGMLTRDPRSKERKKFGLKRARKSPQFSKR
ncbi:30S ribosomal protein S9 [Candidatus Peregrinibacteria bacterium CG10_big_fil_rev_8_21_14_0_10_36_19]|nr:MAG: 30S ribosomal protein S9 [Candidatus Peregrinibacteria bacterium CG10_big_fil_rev_8_21_14_0_10_36_19]